MELFKSVPVWHASVARALPDGGMKPVEDWTPSERQHGLNLLRGTMLGVGQDSSDVHEQTGYTMQVRRLVSDQERASTGDARDVR